MKNQGVFKIAVFGALAGMMLSMIVGCGGGGDSSGNGNGDGNGKWHMVKLGMKRMAGRQV